MNWASSTTGISGNHSHRCRLSVSLAVIGVRRCPALSIRVGPVLASLRRAPLHPTCHPYFREERTISRAASLRITSSTTLQSTSIPRHSLSNPRNPVLYYFYFSIFPPGPIFSTLQSGLTQFFFAERCSSLPYWLRFLSDSSYYHHELNLCLPTTRARHALLSYKRCLVLLPCSSTAMDSVSQRPLPHSNMPQSNAIQGQQSLPPLSQLTNRLPASEHSPAQPRQHTEAGEVRDSGHWSIAPSKREYTRYLSTTRC